MLEVVGDPDFRPRRWRWCQREGWCRFVWRWLKSLNVVKWMCPTIRHRWQVVGRSQNWNNSWFCVQPCSVAVFAARALPTHLMYCSNKTLELLLGLSAVLLVLQLLCTFCLELFSQNRAHVVGKIGLWSIKVSDFMKYCDIYFWYICIKKYLKSIGKFWFQYISSYIFDKGRVLPCGTHPTSLFVIFC